MSRVDVGWMLMLVLGACGPTVEADGSDGVDSGEAPATSTGPVATTSTSTAGTSVGTLSTTIGPDPTTGSEATSSPDTGVTFIIGGDYGDHGDCDLWAQDCPPGQKCMPWANDGGSSWTATRCTDVAPDPRQIGESCTVVDSGVSGIDDCAAGAMCFDVDPDTLTGTCFEMCTGSEAAWMCGQACSVCTLSAQGLINLCLPICDPLAPECPAGQSCLPGYGTFACYPSYSPVMGDIGDECTYVDDCNPGLVCLTADQVPGCAGDGCCAPLCDTSAMMDPCAALLSGSVCTPWSDRPSDGCTSPSIGVCVAP